MLHSVIKRDDITQSWQWKGVGHCVGHFGELIQGMFTASSGTLNRGLVTLPCRGLGTTSEVMVFPGSGLISVPHEKSKILKAVASYCKVNDIGNQVDISVTTSSTIPPGIGMGSSTADIVSSLRALDQAFGRDSTSEEILQSVMSAESACDSIMLGQSVKLFAQREGKILEDFKARLPPLIILGFNLMPGQVFSTEDTPPAKYSKAEIRKFDAMRTQFGQALHQRDLTEIGRISTESAVINQRKHPKKGLQRMIRTAKQAGSLGVCISHSGTISGILFDALSENLWASLSQTSALLRDSDIVPLGTFRI